MTTDVDLVQLGEAVAQLQSNAAEIEAELSSELSRLDPTYREAGRNLAHYLALRQHDLRELQRSLAGLGLSSLGRSERCVIPTLDAVRHALACLAGAAPRNKTDVAPHIDFDAADELLKRHTTTLLGAAPAGRATRIMLTLPAETDASSIEALLAEGADVIRLNCAKGNEDDWARTIERVRLAEKRHGKECRILCDLAGPNPRTASFLESFVRYESAVPASRWIPNCNFHHSRRKTSRTFSSSQSMRTWWAFRSFAAPSTWNCSNASSST